MGASVAGPEGEPVFPEMGSYGIGVSRLAGALIEAFHDSNGIVWPESVAPFDVGIINLKPGDADCDRACESLYGKLRAAGKDPLYDDRDERAGAKFADIELIGLPWQVVVGPRGIRSGSVELGKRADGERREVSLESALSLLTQ